MARDREAEAERRNERARAAGYDSYGQMYRAGKQGYGKSEGVEFHAAREVNRGAELFVARTAAGRVIAAETSGGTGALLRTIGKATGQTFAAVGGGDTGAQVVTATVRKDGNVSLVVERENGNVVHVGGHGGMSPEYLADLVDEYGDGWADYLADTVESSSYGGVK